MWAASPAKNILGISQWKILNETEYRLTLPVVGPELLDELLFYLFLVT